MLTPWYDSRPGIPKWQSWLSQSGCFVIKRRIYVLDFSHVFRIPLKITLNTSLFYLSIKITKHRLLGHIVVEIEVYSLALNRLGYAYSLNSK